MTRTTLALVCFYLLSGCGEPFDLSSMEKICLPPQAFCGVSNEDIECRAVGPEGMIDCSYGLDEDQPRCLFETFLMGDNQRTEDKRVELTDTMFQKWLDGATGKNESTDEGMRLPSQMCGSPPMSCGLNTEWNIKGVPPGEAVGCAYGLWDEGPCGCNAIVIFSGPNAKADAAAELERLQAFVQ